MLRKFIIDYLSFSRKDRIAIIALVLIVCSVFLLPLLFTGYADSKKVVSDTSWIKAMQNLEQKQSDSAAGYSNDYENNYGGFQYDKRTGSFTNKPKGELFYFDPNTLSAEGWERLGIREKTIHTIQNYLSKGGKFRKPEDVQKIYGLFPDEYERIAPFIKIESQPQGFGNEPGYSNLPAVGEKKTFPNTPKYSVVEVNTADTSALIALPGIGSKLAQRIIGFRDKLGGFYSVNQIAETYGLPDSTFQKIKQYLRANADEIRKININTVTIDELKSHPYIKWGLANPIIAFRKEHGTFAKIEDLKKVMVITEDVYNKIAPYIIVQ